MGNTFPLSFSQLSAIGFLVCLNLSVCCQVVKMWGWFLPVAVLLSSVNQAQGKNIIAILPALYNHVCVLNLCVTNPNPTQAGVIMLRQQTLSSWLTDPPASASSTSCRWGASWWAWPGLSPATWAHQGSALGPCSTATRRGKLKCKGVKIHLCKGTPFYHQVRCWFTITRQVRYSL